MRVWLLWRVVWQCLLKLKIGVPFDPVSPSQAPILEKAGPCTQRVAQACLLQLQNIPCNYINNATFMLQKSCGAIKRH